MLAHNPIGALQLADTYYQKVWGPERPSRLPAQPAEARRQRIESPAEPPGSEL